MYKTSIAARLFSVFPLNVSTGLKAATSFHWYLQRHAHYRGSWQAVGHAHCRSHLYRTVRPVVHPLSSVCWSCQSKVFCIRTLCRRWSLLHCCGSKTSDFLVPTAPSNMMQVAELQNRNWYFFCTSCSDPCSHDRSPLTQGAELFWEREHAG